MPCAQIAPITQSPPNHADSTDTKTDAQTRPLFHLARKLPPEAPARAALRKHHILPAPLTKLVQALTLPDVNKRLISAANM